MKNFRNIKYIVVHCTATPTTTTVESIKRYWKEQRGWGDTPGYHYLKAKTAMAYMLTIQIALALLTSVELIKMVNHKTTEQMHKSILCLI